MYPEPVGKEFPLPAHEVIVGRGNTCAVQLLNDSVSRRHAKIYFTGDAWIVEDLQSTNGSYLNDMPVTKSVLHDGDALKVGRVLFKFRLTGACEVPAPDDEGESGSGAPAFLGIPKPRSRN